MQCWVHQDILLNDEPVETNMREAWEHEDSKDEMNIEIQVLEQHFWRETEAGWMGCYDLLGETWAEDSSAHKGVMGAGSVSFQRPGRNLVVRVCREIMECVRERVLKGARMFVVKVKAHRGEPLNEKADTQTENASIREVRT